jgi:hypothetical protein
MDRFWGLGLRARWADGKKQRLETYVGAFVLQLETLADRVLAHRRELEKAQEERRQQEIERAEHERRARVEEERFRALQAEANAWHQSRRLRQYIEAVRVDARTKHGATEAGSELDRWLVWACAQADRLDPLADSEPAPTIPR